MKTPLLLENEVVVISGAGQGIGRATAKMLALKGAKVVVNDIGKSEDGSRYLADQVVEEIVSEGGEAIANYESVSEKGSGLRIINAAISNFGKIDAVVNNAGNLRDSIFHKMTEEDFDSVLSVHLKGTYNLSRAAAEYFRNQGKGTYVHFTSTSGLIGNFGQSNYAAAKMGIVGLSKSIALDMARFGVNSNCIAPFAWSQMTSSIPAETEEEKARVARLQQMTPDKVASLAVSLCSEKARTISGQIFGVRNNEVFLFTQPRPYRFAHSDSGWSPESILDRVFPAFESDFYPLSRSGDVFCWDPF